VKAAEQLKMEIRMEGFDAINHANLSNLQASISNAQAGVSTNRSGSRVVEFGARLSF
jgi:hypothetical protein